MEDDETLGRWLQAYDELRAGAVEHASLLVHMAPPSLSPKAGTREANSRSGAMLLLDASSDDAKSELLLTKVFALLLCGGRKPTLAEPLQAFERLLRRLLRSACLAGAARGCPLRVAAQ